MNSLQILAQDGAADERNNILPPAEEKFQAASELIVPWRYSGCHPINKELNEPNCQTITSKEWESANEMTLYNSDGTVWYQFSINPAKSDHFLKQQKQGFLPFAVYFGGQAVYLRMTGESLNWYEVEINEETRATKFVLKSDPVWAKTSWDHWLAELKFFKFEENQPKLLDKPNGKIADESSSLTWSHLKFLKTKGDWAFVEGYENRTVYRGWIRWRQDRNILVKDFKDLFRVNTPQQE